MPRVTQTNIPQGVIDLGVGHPGLELLPLDELRQAALRRLEQPDREYLQYGAEMGDGYFLVELARFLSRHYGSAVEPGHLLATSGISQAIDLACTAFTRPGDTILVEEPTYFLVLQIFRDHGLNVVGIPTDAGGLSLEALEQALQTHRPRLIYTIPTFQNPTGATQGFDRRRRLVELSQEHGFLILADEVYQLLHYSGAPPPPLANWVDGGTVVSLGSFSKILAPGLRLGWVQSAPQHLRRLAEVGVIASGGGLNPFTSAVVCSALELGLQEAHLTKLRDQYRARSSAMVEALQRHLPGLDFQKPGGGYFIWLEVPTDTPELLPKAMAAGVRFQPGVKFSSVGGLRNALRLCFAYYPPEQLREGVQRLAQVLQR